MNVVVKKKKGAVSQVDGDLSWWYVKELELRLNNLAKKNKLSGEIRILAYSDIP